MLLCEPIKYETVEESLFSDELGSYRSFGIRGTDEAGREVVFCSDISADEGFVRALCERCNAFQLSPVHIFDIIEDSI